MDRRKFTVSLMASAALTGCSASSNENVAGFREKFRDSLRSRSGSGSGYRTAYGAITDGGFDVPEVPYKKIDEQFLRQTVDYQTKYKPGTIVVDVPSRFLYLVQPGGKAMRYGVGVGKAGFAWAGNATIGWKREWPTWTPPPAMIRRRPELAKWAAGMEPGLNNPLGARALYLMKGGRDTLYRLHGTPEWWSIGKAMSSGCIRLLNQDIIDLYGRVNNGAQVIVKQT